MQPLVTASWLHKHFNDPDIIILDASPPSNMFGLKPDYENVRIKGARYFDVDHVFSRKDTTLPHMLLPPEDFSKDCQKLGIDNTSKIVVYDNLGIYMSPRVWWMFRAMGHESVAVLNGGLTAWVKEGYETEPIQEKKFSLGNFKATLNASLVKSADEVNENILTKNSLVFDARSSGRFTGEIPEPRKGLRGGHIPGSFNIPFQDVLANGYYKSPEELMTIFNQYPIGNKPMVFSCGSGVTACIIALAAETILPNPKSVYDGSWTEWAQLEHLPVEKSK